MKTRLVLVDDEHEKVIRLMRRDKFDESRYELTAVKSVSEGLQAIAEVKPLIAIVDRDIPLKSDTPDDLRVTSTRHGTELVKSILEFNAENGFETKVIVLSKYPMSQVGDTDETEITGIAISEEHVVQSVLKNGRNTYAAKLVKRIDRLTEEALKAHGGHPFYNHELRIEYFGVPEFDEEQEDLLKKLFNYAAGVKLFSLIQGFSPAEVFRAYWSSLAEPAKLGQPMLLKLSRDRPTIRVEIEKYYSLVHNKLPFEYYPHMVRPTKHSERYFTENYEGFTSAFVDPQRYKVKEYGKFHSSVSDMNRIRNVLGIIFEKALHQWSYPPEEYPCNIVDEYESIGNDKKYFDLEKINSCYDAFFKSHFPAVSDMDQFDFALGDTKIKVYSPRYILSNVANTHLRVGKKICHGDLNGRNILVSEELNKIWLIDYFFVDKYHALFDHTRFETYIKFEIMKQCDMSQCYALEKSLSSQEAFGAELDSTFQIAELAKCFDTIRTIRDLASAMAPDKADFREYLYGLLFHTLRCYTFDDLAPWQKEFVLLSSSLIFENLGK